MLFPEPVIPITAISMSSGLSGVDAVDRLGIFAMLMDARLKRLI